MRKAQRRAMLIGALVAAFVVACGTSEVGDSSTPTPTAEAGADAPATPDGAAPTDAPMVVDATTDASNAGDAMLGDADADADADAGSTPPNILLVIGDDMGLDASVCHAVGDDPGRAPRIKSLCDNGVVFDNVWSAPVCSPTRAAILTGRHGFRNGVGTVGQPLPLTERALPKALVAGQSKYAVGAFGKWHLSTAANGGANHPNTVGFAQYSGSLPAQVPNYFNWAKTVNGVTATTTQYATSANVDDALAFIQARTGPWFVYLAFNAPHAPYHVPPANLTTYVGLGTPPPPRPLDHYHAMLEAMDTELGRMLDTLGPTTLANTWIIFVGDNGTPSEVSQVSESKGSLYQGGIQVPMVITGPRVVTPGRRVGALVHVLDIFGTVLDLAGADMTKALPAGGNTVDAVSLVPYLTSATQAPLRSTVMTEVFGGAPFDGGKLGKTIRDETHKLIRFNDGSLELYDLSVDPTETTNLVGAGDPVADAHQDALTTALDALLASP